MKTTLSSILAFLTIGFFAPSAKAAIMERDAVASTLILEAGGEGLHGMKSVMWVIRNRAVQRKQTALSVVTRRGQFAVMSAGVLAAYKAARSHPHYRMALAIYDSYATHTDFTGVQRDPTHGATYFESEKRKSALPFWWRAKLVKTVKIGGHCFYRPRGSSR